MADRLKPGLRTRGMDDAAGSAQPEVTEETPRPLPPSHGFAGSWFCHPRPGISAPGWQNDGLAKPWKAPASGRPAEEFSAESFSVSSVASCSKRPGLMRDGRPAEAGTPNEGDGRCGGICSTGGNGGNAPALAARRPAEEFSAECFSVSSVTSCSRRPGLRRDGRPAEAGTPNV